MIVFDLFNTLIYESKQRSIIEVGSELFDIDLETLKSAYTELGCASMSGVISTLEDRLYCSVLQIKNIEYRQFMQTLKPFSSEYDVKLLEFDDAVETLKLLSPHEIFLLTNISKYSIAKVEALPFFKYISQAFYSCTEKVMKPDIYFYKKLSPDKTVYYIGDGEHEELRSAKELGFKTILIDRSLSHSKKAKKDADFCISQLSEIPGIINGKNIGHRWVEEAVSTN